MKHQERLSKEASFYQQHPQAGWADRQRAQLAGSVFIKNKIGEGGIIFGNEKDFDSAGMSKGSPVHTGFYFPLQHPVDGSKLLLIPPAWKNLVH